MWGGLAWASLPPADVRVAGSRVHGLCNSPPHRSKQPHTRAHTCTLQVESMGQIAVRIEGLTHGYDGRTLFKDADLTIERGQRVAVIGANGAGKRWVGGACTCMCCWIWDRDWVWVWVWVWVRTTLKNAFL